jgi:hypothetical protein
MIVPAYGLPFSNYANIEESIFEARKYYGTIDQAYL